MERVYDTKLECCGCTLCAEKCPTNAISMEMTDGFSYPVIDPALCIDCGLCRRVCIIQHPFEGASNTVEAFAGKIHNEDVRMKSSSGGAFTVLSDAILDAGGVVCGAVFDELMHVRHAVTDTAHVRDTMRGSKYVQSDMNGVYAQLQAALKAGRKVLFTGNPCVVAAIKRRFKEFEEQLYTVDLICHGVPSPEMWHGYIAYIERLYGKSVADYTFRDKQKGWRDYHAVVTFSDGTAMENTNAIDSYVELFRYDLCLRPSCTACPYTSMQREGDITLGDFWGVHKVFPTMDDNKGVSAILINTEKGKELLPYLQDRMQLEPCTAEDIAAGQPNMYHPSKASVKADAFARDLHTLPFEKVVKKYTRVGRKRRVIDAVKKVLHK